MLRYILIGAVLSINCSLAETDHQGWPRTQFCDDCLEITVSSTGGTADHQPQTLGKYTRAGSLWENMIPFWKSEKNQFLTPDANSNPILFYIQWVVGGSVGSYDPELLNDEYTDGFNCPYEMESGWKYVKDSSWFSDPTLSFLCTKTRQDTE